MQRKNGMPGSRSVSIDQIEDRRSKSQMTNIDKHSQASTSMVGSSVSGRRKMDIMNDIKNKLLIKYGRDKYTEMAISKMLEEFNQKEKITLKVSKFNAFKILTLNFHI